MPRTTAPRRTKSDIVGHILRCSSVDARGCWVWTGTLSNAGYGRLSWTGAPSGRKEQGAHRVAYSVFVGPIPTGLVVDHLCRNRACVNPDHLEPVTGRENIMRSPVATGAINAKKTHCRQGHAYSPENTAIVVNPGGRSCTTRVCRVCSSAASAKRRAAKAVQS